MRGPILARSQSIYAPIPPLAYDCVKLIFVRHGSAVLLSEFGERTVSVGDVVALGANTLCGSEPEGSITVTTLYLDRDYVIDQVFWQHATILTDRFHARDFADELYSEPERGSSAPPISSAASGTPASAQWAMCGRRLRCPVWL